MFGGPTSLQGAVEQKESEAREASGADVGPPSLLWYLDLAQAIPGCRPRYAVTTAPATKPLSGGQGAHNPRSKREGRRADLALPRKKTTERFGRISNTLADTNADTNVAVKHPRKRRDTKLPDSA